MEPAPSVPSTPAPAPPKTKPSRRLSGRIKSVAPLVILITLPLTVYAALTAKDLVPKLIIGVGGCFVVLLLAWMYIEDRQERARAQLLKLIDDRVPVHLQPIAGLVARFVQFDERLSQFEARITQFEDKEAYRYLSGKYGWGYDSTDITCVIERNGDALYQRIVSVDSQTHNEWVEQSLLVKQVSGARENVKLIDPMGRAQLSEKSEDLQGGYVTRVSFTPPLKPDDHHSFTLLEDLKDQTYRIGVQPKDLEDTPDKVDYVGWRIDRPMRRLSLQVTFPQGFCPRTEDALYAAACYQPLPLDTRKARRHSEEEKRLKIEKLSRTPAGQERFHLLVPDPMLGLVYMIVWDPLML